MPLEDTNLVSTTSPNSGSEGTVAPFDVANVNEVLLLHHGKPWEGWEQSQGRGLLQTTQNQGVVCVVS